MKLKSIKKFLFKIIPLVVAIIFAGCTEKTTDSLYSGNPSGPTGATPEISTVNPPNEALAGVTAITITGKNFLSDTSAVEVYFGSLAGKIISASPTQLTVIPPNIEGAVNIKISTNVAELFSNIYTYSLAKAVKDFYPDAKDKTNVPASIIVDNAGNIYSSNSSYGLVQITPDSVSTVYSAKGGETYWTTMRFGPAGVLYAARGNQAVFTIPAGGGKNSAWVVLTPSSLKISQIEFDPMGNLWAAGKNSAIYRIKPDKSTKSYPFSNFVTAMRIFVSGGTTYLYAAVQQSSNIVIMRMPIDANGDLGTPENYFDFTGNYGANYVVNDITFAADGEMFLATDLPSPIVYVNPDKTSGLLYPDLLLKSPALSLAWGTGNILYYVRRQINDATGALLIPQSIVKVNVEKPGAPYYGM